MNDKLMAIFDRFTNSKYTDADRDADREILRQLLVSGNPEVKAQVAKFNVNIGEGKDIHIGDKLNLALNDKALKSLIEYYRFTVQESQIRSDKYEKNLLDRVREFWVDGVLKKNSSGYPKIELKLEHRPDVIAPLWEDVLENPEQLRHEYPIGTEVIDILDGMGQSGTLLILGQPGSGKTTTLLELAEHKINCAKQNKELPIPVVFKLSTWRNSSWKIRQNFLDWLTQELEEKYKVNKAKSSEWINQQRLLIFLDGLDEVVENQRKSCIESINDYMSKYSSTGVVICCRIEDYERIKGNLCVRDAILIKQLKKNR